MHTELFTIAGGNKTALIWGCDDAQRHEVIQKMLSTVEQLGFISEGVLPHLSMMGEELCINATLALASMQSNAEGEITASGVESNVQYKNSEGATQIHLALPFRSDGEVVLFNGIGFLCTCDEKQYTKKQYAEFATTYGVPAFGIVFYTSDAYVTPIVYVVQTDSLVEETSCGSGSIAVHIITGLTDIVQPTGEVIQVTQEDGMFCVQARVVKV